MGDIYSTRKITYIIPIILFAGGLPFLVIAMLKGFQMYGFSIDGLAGVFGVGIDIAALSLFIYLISVDPLSMIRKISKTNPAAGEQIMKEAPEATKLCKNVFASNSYYFFNTRTKIFVVPRGQLLELELFHSYSKSVGLYYGIRFKSADGKGKAMVSITAVNDNKDEAFAAAKRLADESGIVCKYTNIKEK